MKKLVSAILAAGMILSLAACGGSGSNQTTSAPTAKAEETKAEETKAEETKAEETKAEETKTAANGEKTEAGALKTAAGWPDKTITLLCGYSAGGSSDLGCRYLASALEKQLGVPVIVENAPGSGSTVAWMRLLKNTEPDGNTFALVNLSIVYGAYDETNPREYTIDSFDLLANHVIDYQCVAIRSDDTRFSDYKSLIDYGKENSLICACATTTLTSGDATVAKMMEKNYGCNITIIPVEGAGDAETMFLAGEVDFLIGNVGDMLEAEENGYKVVVVYGDERSQYLPDVPTEIELGMGDYVSFSARGYAYMPGVDEDKREVMMTALANAFEDEEYQKNMAAMGAELKLYTGQEYYDLLKDQLDQRLEIWGVEKK